MDITCMECGEPIANTTTGRPRLYCSNRCKNAAWRRKRQAEDLVPVTHMETVGEAHGLLPPAGSDVDQVVAALVYARAAAGAFLRLGREARPSLAHRCESTGVLLMEALQRNFKEQIK